MKPSSAVTARPGKASGNMIWMNVWLAECSVNVGAASSSSFGIVSMKPFMFQIAKGSDAATIAKPTPRMELRNCGPRTEVQQHKQCSDGRDGW